MVKLLINVKKYDNLKEIICRDCGKVIFVTPDAKAIVHVNENGYIRHDQVNR